jgi:general secretion pathway protein J
MSSKSHHHPATQGFTLIEVMVSLLILAVMSAMAWKGMDSIMRSREIAEASVRRTLRLQSVMKQWQADIGNVVDVQVVPALEFDGATLRMTRRTSGGVQVVAWALRGRHWVRWAGDPVDKVGLLDEQWRKVQQLNGREPGTLAALRGVEQWQVYFYRDTGWTGAQNTAGVSANGGKPSSQGMVVALAASMSRPNLPRGVRCQLTLSSEAGYAGRVTRDVMVAPATNQD